MMFTPTLFLKNEVPAAFNDSVAWDDTPSYMTITPAAPGTTKTFTLSLWFRPGFLGQTNELFGIRDFTQANFYHLFVGPANAITSRVEQSSSTKSLVSNAKLDDLDAWYHVVVAVDTTQATAANRHKIWVNGNQITSFSTENYPALDSTTVFSDAYVHNLGFLTNHADSRVGFALFHMLDDVAADADDFGELVDGVWIPKAYTGAYGTNGALLDFSDSADLGNDSSGNGNDFTLQTVTSANYRQDGPTEGIAWLNKLYAPNNTTLSASNTVATVASVAFETVRGNIMIPPSGKWYWECTSVGTPNATNSPRCGVVGEAEWSSEQGLHASPEGYAYRWDGVAEHDSVSKGYGDGYTINDVIGVAYDAAGGTLEFYLNGVSQGQAYTDIDGWVYPAVSCGSSFAWKVNFGQIPFANTPPKYYRAVSARNMPPSDVTAPAGVCVSALDVGADIATTLAALRSSWTSYVDIYKNRSSTEDWEVIFSDDNANSLHFNTTDAKAAKATLEAGDDYLGVSINIAAAAGIYSAEVTHQVGIDTEVDHGLSCDTGTVAAIVKRVDVASDWYVAHPSLTENRILLLNSDAGEAFDTGKVIVAGRQVAIDRELPSGTYRVIVIAEKFGVSRLTKYTGNGSAAGPYVFAGHRPELVLTKKMGAADDWLLHAWGLTGANPVTGPSAPNLDSTILATRNINATSTGVTIADTDADLNTTATEYISIMLAAVPFGAINGRAANGAF